MAFPFDLIDLFIPEIAHWMAGKSPSQKVRLLRAGGGLSTAGAAILGASLILLEIVENVFGTSGVGLAIGLAFTGVGIFLFSCFLVDKVKNK